MPETEELSLEHIVKLAARIKHWRYVTLSPDCPGVELGDEFAYLTGEKLVSGYFGRIKIEDRPVVILVSETTEGFGNTYAVTLGDNQGPLAIAESTENEPPETDLVKAVYDIAEAKAGINAEKALNARRQLIVDYVNQPEAKKKEPCRKVLAR